MPVGPEIWVKVRYRKGHTSRAVRAKMRRWEAWPPDIGESDWDVVGWTIARDPTACNEP